MTSIIMLDPQISDMSGTVNDVSAYSDINSS